MHFRTLMKGRHYTETTQTREFKPFGAMMYLVLKRKVGTEKWKQWAGIFELWKPCFFTKRRAMAMARLLARRNPGMEYAVTWLEVSHVYTRHWLTMDKEQ